MPARAAAIGAASPTGCSSAAWAASGARGVAHHRLAGEGEELLRGLGPEPAAGAGRDQEGGDAHGGALRRRAGGVNLGRSGCPETGRMRRACAAGLVRTGGKSAARDREAGSNPRRRVYTPAMRIFVAILAGLAMLGVLGVLAAGLIGVARGGGDPQRSNRLMRWRVMLQGAAILFIVLLLWLLRS